LTTHGGGDSAARESNAARADSGGYGALGSTTTGAARPTPAAAARPAAKAGPSGAFLMAPAPRATVKQSLAGITAADYYYDFMKRGGSAPCLTSADKARGKLVSDWFNAMATPRERRLLLPPTKGAAEAVDEGERRHVVKQLHDLVAARLVRAFEDANLKLPTPLQQKKPLSAGAIESRVQDLKRKANVAVVVSAPVFAAFRTQHEETLKAAQRAQEVRRPPAKRKAPGTPPSSYVIRAVPDAPSPPRPPRA